MNYCNLGTKVQLFFELCKNFEKKMHLFHKYLHI